MNKQALQRIVWGVLVLVCFGWVHPALAQRFHLQEIQSLNLGDIYRVIFQCDGSDRVVQQFKDDPPRLVVYFLDMQPELPNQMYKKKAGLVQDIEVKVVNGTRRVTKVTIFLAKKVLYTFNKSVEGLYYVDFKVKGLASETDLKLESLVDRDERDNLSERLTSHWDGADPEDGHTGDAALRARPVAIPKSQSLTAGVTLPRTLRSKDHITLDVKGAEISNVLRLLAKQSGLNIVASQDVKGVLTVSLSNVTLHEALDMVVKANGFDYVADGDVILVKPRDKFQQDELETKVYRLKYIDANNVRSIVSQVLSAHAKIQVFYGNFQPAVKIDEDKASIPEKRSSILVVTDSPANIKQVDAMIATLDIPTPQIMIEAKLVEISPQHEQNIGIDWSKTVNAQIFKEIILPSGAVQRNAIEVPLDGGSINYGTLNVEQYDAVLNFLNTHTHTKLVSNPRILASDNQEAEISVGTTFPIPQINRGVGGQGDFVTFEYRDVNISLKVTPHIGDDETITLHVNPQIEEVIGQVVAGDNSAPITSKRTVETVVNLKSDETMVIGGLIKENTTEQTSKIWLLGDIPLLGNFFRNKHKTKSQTDLLIFITPRLVKDFR